MYVCPSRKEDGLPDIVQHFSVFTWHPQKPYVRQFKEISRIDLHNVYLDSGQGYGFDDYLSDVQKLYTPGYKAHSPLECGGRTNVASEYNIICAE